MSQRFDLLTVALANPFAFNLLVSTILALIVSFLALRLYRRAVIASMRRRSQSELLETRGYLPPEPKHRPHDAPLSFTFVLRGRTQRAGEAARLYRRVQRRRWRTAGIYTVAGIGFATAMTAATMAAERTDFALWRFIYIAWVNLWPLVLAVDLAVGLSRRGRLSVGAFYFIAGAAIGSFAAVNAPGLSMGRLVQSWIDANALATLLLLIFLHRRIRAAGPLMMVFIMFTITGANLIVTWIRTQAKLLKPIRDLSAIVGLGPTDTLVALQVAGFAAFAIIGWLVFGALSSLYRRKLISEQAIVIDSVWLVFGTVNSIFLTSRGAWWILSGIAAVAVYKILALVLFRALAPPLRGNALGRRLLLLRVAALGKRRETLYETLAKSWRTIGSIQMIAGPESATSGIQPHEFWDFVSGNLPRRFIDSGRTLDLRIDHMDLAPDRDGQFRVTEFFCHDDTWRLTLARLADEADATLMDLRGFSPANSAHLFEIQELFNVVALPRIVFAVDDSTDQPYMRRTMQQAWAQLKDRSPNSRLSAGQVSLVDLSGMTAARLHDLLHGLCRAATAGTK